MRPHTRSSVVKRSCPASPSRWRPARLALLLLGIWPALGTGETLRTGDTVAVQEDGTWPLGDQPTTATPGDLFPNLISMRDQ